MNSPSKVSAPASVDNRIHTLGEEKRLRPLVSVRRLRKFTAEAIWCPTRSSQLVEAILNETLSPLFKAESDWSGGKTISFLCSRDGSVNSRWLRYEELMSCSRRSGRSISDSLWLFHESIKHIFSLELIHPSHVTTAETISSCAIQSAQRPVSKFTTKKGNQQTMKTPGYVSPRTYHFHSIRQVDVESINRLWEDGLGKKKRVFSCVNNVQ